MRGKRLSRRAFLRSAAAFAGLAAVGSLAATCGPTATPKATEKPVTKAVERKLVIAHATAPASFDPQLVGGMVNHSILRNIYDNLVIRNKYDTLKFDPQLAVSWKNLDDFTWQFKLRQGVKFHNGEEFDAEVVKYSFERLVSPELGSAGVVEAWTTFKEVQIVDKYTVNVVTRVPDPILLTRAAGLYTCMVPPKYAEEVGRAEFALNPVGTGPFKFVSWVKDGDLTLQANPNYWGGPVPWDKVVIKVIPEDAVRAAALRAREVDIVVVLPPHEVPVIERDKDLRIMVQPSTRFALLTFDYLRPPTNDRRVRQAVRHAVDVESLCKNIMGGYATPVATEVTPGVFGYHPGLKPYPYDPAKAKKLLAEAGYPDGLDIVFDHTYGTFFNEVEFSQAVAGMLNEAGFRVKLQMNEPGAFGDKSNANTLGPIFEHSRSNPWFDASFTIASFFRCRKGWPDKVTSRTTYCNEEMDRLISEGESTMDLKKREEIYHKMLEILYEDAVRFPMFSLNWIYVANNRIEWVPRKDDMELAIEARLKE